MGYTKTCVTVIIPVYNMQSTIARAIDSCINQSLDSVEILCVNDGSSDNSEKIIMDYCSRYQCVRIINQSNSGVGSARNKGIYEATGNCIMFLDADDELFDGEALETLYMGMKNNNVLVAGGSIEQKRNGKIIDAKKGRFSNNQLYFDEEKILCYQNYQGYLGFTRYMYNREFLIANELFFPNYSEYEDPVFLINVLLKADTIWTTNKAVYTVNIGNHIRLYNNVKSVEDALRGILEICVLTRINRLGKLLANVLLDCVDTRMDIFLYPYLHEQEHLIQLTEKVFDSIDISLLNAKDALIVEEFFNTDGINTAIDTGRRAIERLEEQSRKYEKIVIYGAGVPASMINAFLQQLGIESVGFAVTNITENPSVKDGKSVNAIDYYSDEKESLLVIIGIMGKNRVEEELKERGFANVMNLNFSLIRAWIE